MLVNKFKKQILCHGRIFYLINIPQIFHFYFTDSLIYLQYNGYIVKSKLTYPPALILSYRQSDLYCYLHCNNFILFVNQNGKKRNAYLYIEKDSPTQIIICVCVCPYARQRICETIVISQHTSANFVTKNIQNIYDFQTAHMRRHKTFRFQQAYI